MRLIDADALIDAMDGVTIHEAKEDEAKYYLLVSLADVLALIDNQPTKEPDINLIIALNKTIDCLELSVRSYNCLRRWGINTIAELYEAKNKEELPKIRNLGLKSVYEIEHKLNMFLSGSDT